jgi:hypothetical protein
VRPEDRNGGPDRIQGSRERPESPREGRQKRDRPECRRPRRQRGADVNVGERPDVRISWVAPSHVVPHESATWPENASDLGEDPASASLVGDRAQDGHRENGVEGRVVERELGRVADHELDPGPRRGGFAHAFGQEIQADSGRDDPACPKHRQRGAVAASEIQDAVQWPVGSPEKRGERIVSFGDERSLARVRRQGGLDRTPSVARRT